MISTNQTNTTGDMNTQVNHVAVTIEESEVEIAINTSGPQTPRPPHSPPPVDHLPQMTPMTPNQTAGAAGSSVPTNQDTYDNDFLHRVVQDAGRWAYGIVMVEVWVLNEQRTHLERPESAWWIDPIYHQQHHPPHQDHPHPNPEEFSKQQQQHSRQQDNEKNPEYQSCPLCRLIDATRPDYLVPHHLPPGVGLPGALWQQVQQGNPANGADLRGSDVGGGYLGLSTRVATRRRERSTRTSADDDDGTYSIRSMRRITTHLRTVQWREVKPLSQDPDQPWNPRLRFLANECGLGWAAGVPFDMGGHSGIVVFMARANVDISRLSDPVNEDYLIHATLVIGAAYSMRGPRQAAVQARKLELKETIRRVKNKIRAAMLLGKKLDEVIQDGELPSTQPNTSSAPLSNTAMTSNIGMDTTKWLITKLQLSWRKFFGANVQAPPVFTWEQTAWTFFGSFATLLVLTRLSLALTDAYGLKKAIVLGYVRIRHNSCKFLRGR